VIVSEAWFFTWRVSVRAVEKRKVYDLWLRNPDADHTLGLRFKLKPATLLAWAAGELTT
jgi:hypothetical protein